MDQIDLDRYIYKLVPDYMYIDYAEREYWTKHMTNPNVSIYDTYPTSGTPWYNIINIMFDISSDSNNGWKRIPYGRCLLVSPVELIFNTHADEIIHQLKNYGDRYVYACFSSEDALLRVPEIEFKGNPAQIRSLVAYDSATNKYNGDMPYVVELRF